MNPKRSSALAIKKWAEDDKPREKLRNRGCETLSDAELIAILIRSGTRDQSAVSLAKQILATANHRISDLSLYTLHQLIRFRGIGEAKAITIMAAFEIGRRNTKDSKLKPLQIKDSAGAYRILLPKLAHLQHEEFWILYLNNANRVIHEFQLSKGGLTGTLVDVRLLLKKALEVGAVALILGHNHPSGTLVPSKADKEITQKIQQGARVMDIKILDHLIITREDYFSFADQNLLL
ncbi:MAG: DNA repair protein RadC [Bacteroidia bacterium]|nr:DNA repair protein RadC [Bacteroidia bacterium]